MPPEATREQVGQGIGALGSVARDFATFFPRAAQGLTEEAMTNVPGQDPQYLTSTIQQAADVGRSIPFTAAGAESALTGLARQAAVEPGFEAGMYKLVPSGPHYPGYGGGRGTQSYTLLGHEDEEIMDVPNVRYNPKSKMIKSDLYSSRPYKQMDYKNQALLKNRGAWSLTDEDKLGLNRALLREFPEAETIMGHRVSGARRGEEQEIPLRYWVNPQDVIRETEALPRFPEMERELSELAMESIANKGASIMPPGTPDPFTSPPVGNPAWTGPPDPFAHNQPPAMPTSPRSRAGLPRTRSWEQRWSNPEMSQIRQDEHGYSVLNREGIIMAQGASRNEAIANAERLGAQRPPINTRAHERMFGIQRQPEPPEPPDPTELARNLDALVQSLNRNQPP
jgi:hypothetical protein